MIAHRLSRLVAASVILLLAAIIAEAAEPADDTRLTWERAELWLDLRPYDAGRKNGFLADAEMQSQLASLPSGTRLPTVVVAHGCSYIKSAAWEYARRLRNVGYAVIVLSYIKSAAWEYARRLRNVGYAVIVLDSYARPNRRRSCTPYYRDPVRRVSVDELYVLRLEEIRLAAERVVELPWVDRDNLFLLGHGEGGVAAAAYGGPVFRARVISGAPCPLGIGAPRGTPLLVVAAEADPLFGKDHARSCVEAGASLNPPPEVVRIAGTWIDISGSREARAAVFDFLDRHTRR
jgi:dienelactone hydrolase